MGSGAGTIVKRGVLAVVVVTPQPASAPLNHFKPSLLPAASSEIDSRMRLARVSGRFAV